MVINYNDLPLNKRRSLMSRKTQRDLRVSFAQRITSEASGAEATKYTVSGTVTDPAESPIEGVTVTVSGTTLTDDSAAVTGAFSIASVPSGAKTLTLTKTDFKTKSVPVELYEDTAVGAIVFNQYFDISGNIVDGVAAALENVAVTLYADAAKAVALATTLTDASGDFAFTGDALTDPDSAEIIEGTYYIEAVLAGYTADADPLSVPVAADVTDADFVLTAD